MDRYIAHVSDPDDLYAIAAERDDVLRVLPRIHMLILECDSDTADQLVDDPRVDWVNPDEEGEGAEEPANSQAIVNEWHLDRIDQRALPLNDEYRWDYDGDGVRVYILDTGIRGTHEAFSGRIGPGFSALSSPHDDPYIDPAGHGTRVAGAVAGLTTGPARGATICSAKFSSTSTSGSDSNAATCINWILSEEDEREGRAVVVFSWSIQSSTIAVAVQDLIDAGIPFFLAAMNDGIDIGTGATPLLQIPEVYVVSSTQIDDSWGDHNYGVRVDMLAPGRDVWTTMETGDSNYDARNGTSYATPIVAGVAATLLEEHPDLSILDLREIMGFTATRDAITGIPGSTTENVLIYSNGRKIPRHPSPIVKVGTFEKPASAELQQVRWALDDHWPSDTVPEAVILFGIGVRTSPPIDDDFTYGNMRHGLGFMTRRESFAHSASSVDTTGFNNVTRRVAGGPIHFIEGNSIDTSIWTVSGVGNFTSVRVNGFDLNWANVSTDHPFLITYVAIGGEGVEAAIRAWQWPGSTGNFSISSLNFQPETVIHAFSRFDGSMSGARQVGPANVNLGVMTDNGNQWAFGTQITTSGSPTNRRAIHDNRCVIYPSATAGTLLNPASFVSMNSDGFTVNCHDTGANRWVLSLCLRGIAVDIGTFVQSADAGPQTIDTPGVVPRGVILATSNQPIGELNNGSVNNAYYSIGASDGDTSRFIASAHPASTNSHKQRQGSDSLIVFNNSNVNPDASATISSFDAGSFTLDWDESDSTGAMVGYVAFGQPPAPQVEFVNQVTGSQTFGSSRSVNTPADVEPGDYMLAYWNTAGVDVSATGWDVVEVVGVASNHRIIVLARVVEESEPSSHNFTLSGSTNARWHVAAYRNVDLDNPFIQFRRFRGGVSQPLVAMDPLVANRHGSAMLTWGAVGTASITLVLDDWFEKISEQTTTRSVTATMNTVDAGTVSPPWSLKDSGDNSRNYSGTGLTLQPVGNDTPPTTIYGIDTVAGSDSNTTSHEILFSNWILPTEGTFLLMYLRHLSAGGTVPTPPAGWSLLWGPIEYISGATARIYGKFYEESDGSSVTVTYNNGAGSAINIKQFANVDEADPLNFADHATGNSNKASAPTPSKDAGFYEYRASFGQNLNPSSVDNALYTLASNSSGYNTASAFILHDGGTLPEVAFNYGTTANWIALVFALNEVAEPGEELPPMPVNVAANALDHQSIYSTADPGD